MSHKKLKYLSQESGKEGSTPIPQKVPSTERVQNKNLNKVLLFKLTLCSPRIIFSDDDLKECGGMGRSIRNVTNYKCRGETVKL